MSRKIKLIKNVLIAQNLTGISSFSKRIDIEFVPDSVIIKSFNYDEGTPEDGTSLIHSNLINDYVAVIIDPVTSNPNIEHQLYGPIHGNYEFQVRNTVGALDATRAGIFVVQLQFIQYE